MKIHNVAASFPSRTVSNAEVVELVRLHSKDHHGDLDRSLRVVKTLLDRSGLVSRRWCAPGEKPIDHLRKAATQALDGSGLAARDVELFIYVGIGGGFREPANSYMVARSLGFTRAECFDVTDACMSWTRAMSLVDSLFKTRHYASAMIVNAEFNMTSGGPLFPANFALQNAQQLEYMLPSYTIGEVATATLLRPEAPDNFRFTFHSRPEWAELCTIPGAGYDGFSTPDLKIGALGVGRFTAWGAELHARLEEELPLLIEKAGIEGYNADIVFTHSSSSTEWQKAVEKHDLARNVYHVYPHTGNIVSASIPTALACAEQEGRLRRGDEVLCLMGSAGMSFAATTFTY
jgi:3-oxoacyl-[acyl-carrier-protein] synthase III